MRIILLITLATACLLGQVPDCQAQAGAVRNTDRPVTPYQSFFPFDPNYPGGLPIDPPDDTDQPIVVSPPGRPFITDEGLHSHFPYPVSPRPRR